MVRRAAAVSLVVCLCAQAFVPAWSQVEALPLAVSPVAGAVPVQIVEPTPAVDLFAAPAIGGSPNLIVDQPALELTVTPYVKGAAGPAAPPAPHRGIAPTASGLLAPTGTPPVRHPSRVSAVGDPGAQNVASGERSASTPLLLTPASGDSASSVLRGGVGERATVQSDWSAVFDGAGTNYAQDPETPQGREPVIAPAPTEDAPRLEKPARRSAARFVVPALLLLAVAHPLGSLLSPASGVGAALGALSYGLANGLSFLFPLPQAYEAYAEGGSRDFPVVRASLGMVGAIAVGVINAAVLGMPLWGILHVFIGLGMIAPAIIGARLARNGGPIGRYRAPQSLAGQSRWARLRHRLNEDKALRRALYAGLGLSVLSAGIYFAAAAFIPAALTAALPAQAVADLLVWVQLFKGALFIAVFAPDAVKLAQGKTPHGFTPWFNLLFFLSGAAFVFWGLRAAYVSPAGPFRTQYLIHAGRNLLEALAALFAFIAAKRPAHRS